MNLSIPFLPFCMLHTEQQGVPAGSPHSTPGVDLIASDYALGLISNYSLADQDSILALIIQTVRDYREARVASLSRELDDMRRALVIMPKLHPDFMPHGDQGTSPALRQFDKMDRHVRQFLSYDGQSTPRHSR